MHEIRHVTIAVVLVLSMLIVYASSVLSYKFYLYNLVHRTLRFRKVMMSDVYDGLKTGDMILFIPFVHGFSNSLLTIQAFSHIGLVLKKGGETFITESSPPTELAPKSEFTGNRKIKNRNGSFSIQFLPRAKYYCGQIFVSKLEFPLSKAQEKIFLDFCAENDGYPYPSLVQMAGKIIGIDNPTLHCFEYIGRILDSCSMIPEKSAKKFSEYGTVEICEKIISMVVNSERMIDGNSYGYPKMILCDFDTDAY